MHWGSCEGESLSTCQPASSQPRDSSGCGAGGLQPPAPAWDLHPVTSPGDPWTQAPGLRRRQMAVRRQLPSSLASEKP